MRQEDHNDAWMRAGVRAEMVINQVRAKAAPLKSTFNMERFLTDFFQRTQDMGLTNRHIAMHLGVSLSAIAMLRVRKRAPGFPTLLKMAKFAQLEIGNYRGVRS